MANRPLGNLRDFESRLLERRLPATGLTQAGQPGPPDSPLAKTDTAKNINDIINELKKENFSATPYIRSAYLNATPGLNLSFATLDWSSVGAMGRFMLRNAGPSTIYFAFDTNGENVDVPANAGAIAAFASDRCIEVPSGESWQISKCSFSKIGVRMVANGLLLTAKVHAIAFEEAGGRGRGAIL